MYKHCTTEESVLRQRRIEQCLLENMRRCAYSSISVSDLCAQAGISRNTFYRYYDSKDDVLDALLDHTLMEHGKTQLPAVSLHSEAPAEIIQLLLYWQRQKPLLDALVRSNLEAKLVERVYHHARVEDPGILRRMGCVVSGCENEMLLFLMSGIMSLVLSWHRGGFQKPVTDIAKALTRLMFQPLFHI